MYVELYGDNTQEENGLPRIVHLRVRHGGSSYFKDGNGNIKQFHQKLADSSWRKITFNRFSITNENNCNLEIDKGNGKYGAVFVFVLFCFAFVLLCFCSIFRLFVCLFVLFCFVFVFALLCFFALSCLGVCFLSLNTAVI